MAIMEGPLSKWTNVMKGWQYRWFVLDENAGLLSYYTSKEKMMRGSRRGCVRLKGAVIGIDDEDDSTFTITVDQKTFHFQARDADEKDQWTSSLEQTIRRHTMPSVTSVDWKMTPRKSFHDKLAEADAYLQIMIKQVQSLDARIPLCKDDESRVKHTNIRDTALAMVESIKEAIVLLQISKTSAIGSNNWVKAKQDGEKMTPLSQASNLDKDVTLEGALDALDALADEVAAATAGNDDDDHVYSAPLSASMPNLNAAAATTGSEITLTEEPAKPVMPVEKSEKKKVSLVPPTYVIPDLSYSSSDEDDYFDAQESSKNRRSTSKGSPVKRTVPNTHVSIQEGGALKRSMSPVVAPIQRRMTAVATTAAADALSEDEDAQRRSTSVVEVHEMAPALQVIRSKNDYYDDLYDDQSEDELESLNMHGSVITHLLSQVRIGMDLTKIVLPTFILERRSLLEMFADFLAHPDLFVGVVSQPTPRDRMVQVVRWYLSAFHAGRPSEIAKKPYNPILGETFQCYYEVPDSSPDSELSKDGPLPWVKKNNIAFIAEQVSHHPPISAFYAEHYASRISLDGYVWTKSKFLGLSIGVHMIGPAVLTVIDHGEDYILMFPNAYGRSILTVPWVELGGKIHISCAKTGYFANITFHTKPFYGGKKNQISAEICAPNDKKPFCTITGEWNGVMWAKYDTGENEVFLDTKKMPVVKKLVKPIDQQTEFESRRLWKEVTRCLKEKDVEGATEHKMSLENRQRQEAKQRHQEGKTWQTKRFHEVGEHWVYDAPLVRRIGAVAT